MKIFSTLSGQKEEFKPHGDVVTMYVCGVNPYADAHIGHAMSYVIFDMVRRFLEFRGYKVKHVENVTDIEDNIINYANRQGISVRELTEKFTIRYFEDMDALNILRPHFTPKATETIPEIIGTTHGLIERDYAYEAKGSVYFRVTKMKDYGKLSHRTLDMMEAGARIEPGEEKEHPMDFVLWKVAKPGEPFWDSPWGKGRPGWHIECSAMSIKFLGEQIDIHGGGQDLIFPHHENEIAQSECFTGKKPFVKYWMHNGLLQMGAEKMSKSLGNLITIRDALQKYSADGIRLFILSSYYRNPLTYSEEAIEAAERGAGRLRQALTEKGKTAGKKIDATVYRQRFIEFMDDDFSTPQAIATLFDLAREINRFGDEGYNVIHGQQVLVELAEVLGLTLRSQKIILDTDTDELRRLLIEIRDQQRKDKQWQIADRIRNALANRNIAIEDTPRGTSWTPRGMHSFNIATNLCQRFVIGYEEEKDNFYLKGETLGNRPVVSCRIFNSEGEFVYGLEKNNLSPGSPAKYRFVLTKEGWHRVIDDEGNELLRIESRVAENENSITYILGTFFDKNRNLAAQGTGSGLIVNCPLKMG